MCERCAEGASCRVFGASCGASCVRSVVRVQIQQAQDIFWGSYSPREESVVLCAERHACALDIFMMVLAARGRSDDASGQGQEV